MKNLTIINLLLLVVVCAGCQTTKDQTMQAQYSQETIEDVQQSLGSVAGAMTNGKALSEEDLKKLAKDLRKDPEARSAVEAITGSMGDPNRRIKYNPQTGERYAPHLTEDPKTGEPLIWLEE